MSLRELNLEQRLFAAENHDLVYTFLDERKLSPDDYYDVVVFGYLEAVQNYLLLEALREQYSFKTVASRVMERILKDFRAEARKMKTISLDTLFVNDDDWGDARAEGCDAPDFMRELCAI